MVVDNGRLSTEETPQDENVEPDFWLFDNAGHAVAEPFVAAVPTAAALAIARRAPVGDPASTEIAGVRLLRAPAMVDGARVGTVVVSASLSGAHTATRVSLVAALLPDVVVLTGTVALTAATVRAALAPVEAMTTAAAQWSAGDAEQRFVDDGDVGSGDELTHLARTLNDMLGRQAGLLRHEKLLTAEIAHELKTPLARLRSSAEVALSYGSASDRAQALVETMDEAQRLADTVDLLLTAGAAHPGACDATAVVARLLDDYRGSGIDVALTSPREPVPVRCDPSLLTRILIPLIDNARIHGGSGVTCSVTRQGSEGTVEVSDDGPGFDPDEFEAVVIPGARGRTAVAPGHGLGLSLARRLTQAAGGTVSLQAGPGGCVTVVLPAA